MRMKNLLGLAVATLALAVLSGCASLPSPEVMKAETATFTLPKMPEPGKAIVYIVRPEMMGGAIRFNVFVDDQEDVGNRAPLLRRNRRHHVFRSLLEFAYLTDSSCPKWCIGHAVAAAG